MISSFVLLSERVLYVVERGEIGDASRRRWYP